MSYRENYIGALQSEIAEMVEDYLTPIALRYGYSDVPLGASLKWRPQVLVIGNYSSGKSTLINEFLGAKIQATGQAPTDDSFTVITYGEPKENEDGSEIRVVERRDGKYLLNDSAYPFESLKKFGQRFAAHFTLKKVNSPFLKNLSIIDTPGMLDSVSERDRGYNYQEVIGELAKNADLVMVLFDPHKSGTGREAHATLRETLPASTFEDRILLVLNRVDECASLMDLLRVYGTLCWNLSQMTGRKDIPAIHLTYSPHVVRGEAEEAYGFLRHLENQREQLKVEVQQAPRYHLDKSATFVETHAERLVLFLQALLAFRKRYLWFRVKYMLAGVVASAIGAVGTFFGLTFSGLLPGADPVLLLPGVAGAGLFYLVLWVVFAMKRLDKRFQGRILENLDDLSDAETQTQKDNWESVKGLVKKFLIKSQGAFPLTRVHQELARVKLVAKEGTREIREALNELADIPEDADDGPDLSFYGKVIGGRRRQREWEELDSIYENLPTK